MKLRGLLLLFLWLVMAVTIAVAKQRSEAVSENREKTLTSQQLASHRQMDTLSVVEKAEKHEVTENTSARKLVEYVDKKIESLRQDIERLNDEITELQEDAKCSGGGSHWIWFGAFVFGVIGGVLSGSVKKLIVKLIARDVMSSMGQRSTVQQPVEQQQITQFATQRCQQQKRQPTNQTHLQSIDKSLTQESLKPAKTRLAQSQKNAVEKEEIESVTSKAEVSSAPKVKQQQKLVIKDKTRIAYANFVIPQRGMLIVYDDYLCDCSDGQQFKLEINETNGTATYTFVPDVLKTAIDNLSSYENFVDNFEYFPSATQVEVVSPGKLHHEEGFWQVDELLKINIL